MRRPLLLSAAFVTLFLPLVALAHATLSQTETSGAYSSTLSFFGDAAFAKEDIRFDLFLYSSITSRAVPFADADVSISRSGARDSTSVTTQRPPDYLADATTFAYTFPSSGDYEIKIAFRNKSGTIAKMVFKLYVHENPSIPDALSASAQPAPSSAASGVAGGNARTVAGLVAVGVLLLGGGGYFYARYGRRHT